MFAKGYQEVRINKQSIGDFLGQGNYSVKCNIMVDIHHETHRMYNTKHEL